MPSTPGKRIVPSAYPDSTDRTTDTDDDVSATMALLRSAWSKRALVPGRSTKLSSVGFVGIAKPGDDLVPGR